MRIDGPNTNTNTRTPQVRNTQPSQNMNNQNNQPYQQQPQDMNNQNNQPYQQPTIIVNNDISQQQMQTQKQMQAGMWGAKRHSVTLTCLAIFFTMGFWIFPAIYYFFSPNHYYVLP